MGPTMTKAEKRCCHMGQCFDRLDELEAWRKEFHAIPRSEHCRDCPIFARQGRMKDDL